MSPSMVLYIYGALAYIPTDNLLKSIENQSLRLKSN